MIEKKKIQKETKMKEKKYWAIKSKNFLLIFCLYIFQVMIEVSLLLFPYFSFMFSQEMSSIYCSKIFEKPKIPWLKILTSIWFSRYKMPTGVIRRLNAINIEIQWNKESLSPELFYFSLSDIYEVSVSWSV